MHTLMNWEARRAGGRITVRGRKPLADGSPGEEMKIVGVDAIEPVNGKVIATHKDGEEYELLV